MGKGVKAFKEGLNGGEKPANPDEANEPKDKPQEK
jgi:hypothetical protein